MNEIVDTTQQQIWHNQFRTNGFHIKNQWVGGASERLALLNISKLVCSSLDLHTVLSEITVQMVKLLSATSAYIHQNNPLSDTSVVLAEHYGAEASDKEIRSILGEIYKFHRNFLGDEFNPFKSSALQCCIDDEDLDTLQEEKMMKYGVKTLLVLPVQVQGKIIAIAEIWESRQPREFSREECMLAQVLAQYAALAIGNAHPNNETQQEVEKRQRIQQALEHDTFHDPLTGLPNRSMMHDLISQAIGRVNGKPNCNYAVLLLGLDHFKPINNSLGHQIGDKLLAGVADRLQFAIRAQDTLARVGGDEFAILVENINHVGDAIAEAVNLISNLRSKFNIGPYEITTSASIGIVMGNLHHQSPDQVLRDVEIALHHAKGDGRGGYRIFHPDMQSAEIDLYRTVGSLRYALEKNQFELYYQPVVSISSNHLVGFEALIRWNHPSLGTVPAAKFISIAEDSGLIYPIGIWTLHKACEQIETWKKQFPNIPRITIGINISAKQLQDANLIDEIHTLLLETGIAPETLILEITESSVIQNMNLAIQNTQKLKELGIQIHLDDFGIGHSSLNVLHNLPIDTLKLDRSFVSRIAKDPRSLDIVKSVVSLCKKLDIDVVAEGIETEFEVNILKNIQCELGQGYYFSKPVDEENASLLIRKFLNS